jgi:hypothetical protein
MHGLFVPETLKRQTRFRIQAAASRTDGAPGIAASGMQQRNCSNPLPAPAPPFKYYFIFQYLT